MAQHAARYSVEQVGEFLKSIGMGQYVEIFAENEMSGEMMLEADDKDLEEIGVESRLHRIKIMVLFKRYVYGQTAKLVDEFDGRECSSVLLFSCLLTSSHTHVCTHTHTITQPPTFIPSTSIEDVADFLKAQKLDAYIDIFKVNGIDGDILSAIVARKDTVQVEGKGEMVVADIILQDDLGMNKAVHRLKVKGKIRKFVDSLASVRSVQASSR